MSMIRASALAGLTLFLGAAGPAEARLQTDSSHQQRFRGCMGSPAFDCIRRVIEGDLPYAVFQDRSGKRTRVRVCVRDREGRRCWPRQRPAERYGVVQTPIMYRTTGKHVTTWRVKGKVVRRWSWRVKPEPE